MRQAARWLRLVLCGALVAPSTALAVIISSGDGTDNTMPPTDDPGWANVGRRGGLTGVYLQNGWVLTARHVGAGPFQLGGSAYDPIPGSTVEFDTAPGDTADLVVFKLAGEPPQLAALPLADHPPVPAETVVMIGNGRNRGTAITWDGRDGWLWGNGGAMRWGNNLVSSADFDLDLGGMLSRVFSTTFTPQGSGGLLHEAQAAVGDSGGVGFIERSGSWELAGIMIAIGTFPGQDSGPDCTHDPDDPSDPPTCVSAAIFGNLTYLVDLSEYRTAILDVVTVPACSNGLDDDGDGSIDVGGDPGCDDALDASERGSLACDDGIDNDGDGAADYPSDAGCPSSLGYDENPTCQDGIDNDGDGGTDWDGSPADPQCQSPYESEYARRSARCGLGVELALLAPALRILRARARRRRLRG